jgi:hypothetical protein
MLKKWKDGTAYKIFNIKKGRVSNKKGKTWEEFYGVERTKELKKKIKESGCNIRKGDKNPFYGKHHTKENIEKDRKKKLGKKISEETRRNMVKSAIRGEKNHLWKGGITKLNYQIRNSREYLIWKNKVFERDKYTCQDCKRSGCYIECHHKKLFSKILEENKIKTFNESLKCKELWDINKGITLCLKCHSKVDKYRNKLTKNSFNLLHNS